MRAALLVAALLAALPARAGDTEEGPSQGRLEAWLAVGGTVGRQDIGLGLVNRRGWGPGLGVRAGLPFEVADKLSLGVWGGLDALGGPMASSLDDGGGYLRWGFEGGGQVGYVWRRVQLLARVGKYWLSDNATQQHFTDPAFFSGWLLRLRADQGPLSAEVGFGLGEFSHEHLVFRYRTSFLSCPGIMLEHFDASGFTQTSSTHLRVFWSVDF